MIDYHHAEQASGLTLTIGYLHALTLLTEYPGKGDAMRKRLGWLPALAATATAVVLIAGTASAAVIWPADPAQGIATFGHGNCVAPGRAPTVTDATHRP